MSRLKSPIGECFSFYMSENSSGSPSFFSTNGLLLTKPSKMKTLFCIITALLLNSFAFSQEFKDLIVTESETIQCKITLVNDQSIFYDHLVRNKVVNDYLPLSSVKHYKKEGQEEKSNVNSIDLDSSEYAKEQFSYCEIITTKIPFRDKVEIYVDYGDGAGQHYIKGKNGKILSFSSSISALNYMGKRGWEIFSTYTVNVDAIQATHYLLKKTN